MKIFNFKFLIFKNGGQSSIELLVALTVFVLGISAVIAVIYGGQNLLTDSNLSNRALAIARENLEIAQATARGSFPNLVSTSSVAGAFTKEIVVTVLDASTKRVVSRVSWQTDPLRVQKVELTEIITDWKTVKDTGSDTGGGDTLGDWQNPTTLGSVDLGPGNSATGLDVLNKYIYLSAQASDSKKPDFFVIDARSGQNIQIVTSTDTGKGLNGVDTIAGIAYLAQDDTSNQLQIVNTSNPGSGLPLLAEFTLPGVSGAGAIGKSIFYSAGKVYIGTQAASGPEFHIVDVANPASPSELGSFELGADVAAIQVSGHYAYLATSADSKELTILDVANPAAITEAGSFNAAGGEDGLSLYLYGSTLYLGRAAGSNPDFYILNVSNPSAVSAAGSATLGANVNGIRIRNTLAFIGTSDSNKEFQVWNISNPANITLWSSFNFPQVATGIDYEDNLVYVAVRSNDAVRIITSQ